MSWRLVDGQMLAYFPDDAGYAEQPGDSILVKLAHVDYDEQVQSLRALLTRTAPDGRLSTKQDAAKKPTLTRCPDCNQEMTHPDLFYSACLRCQMAYVCAERSLVLEQVQNRELARMVLLAARQHVKYTAVLQRLIDLQIENAQNRPGQGAKPKTTPST
jgi:hypothetical protein